jgi:O-Antigen ligase
MIASIKALIVVLTIAATIFVLAKPIALRFMSMEDFSRRRLMWFVLTIVSFVSPNFWLYALVAVPMLIWANRKDSNPIALYLVLLHVVPPVGAIIPVLGNNGLFPLDNYRLLAFCVLLPATICYRKKGRDGVASVFGAMDILLLAFGALQVALYVAPDLPHHFMIPDSPANALRRAVLYLLDIYLLYYAVSRICQSRKQLLEAAAGFCLGCAVMAALAMFERTRNWLLFVDIATRWGTDATFYLARGGSVRAQVSAGHSIALGYLLVVAFGFWLGLKSQLQKRMQHIGVTLLFWGGLFGAFSRGGWLGGAAVFFTFNAVGPRATSRVVKGAAVALAVGALVAASPLGDAIIDLLPKAGQVADEYRHRLAERGWEVALANPFFGDQFPWPKMEDLRQGEGIIDIVNTYLGVALNYGLVGLFLFVGFILFGMIKTYIRVRELTTSDPDFALFGASLIACIVGTLIMIESSSFIMGCQKMFYVLAGLATAYARLTTSPPHQPAAFSARNTLRD